MGGETPSDKHEAAGVRGCSEKSERLRQHGKRRFWDLYCLARLDECSPLRLCLRLVLGMRMSTRVGRVMMKARMERLNTVCASGRSYV
jgi:hypothetical protein